MKQVCIDGESLRVEDVVAVARNFAQVEVPSSVFEKVVFSREVLEKLVEFNETIYGVNTGFGALGNVRISREDVERLQVNLIRSHSAGVGKPLGLDVVRAMMLLRANTLAKGYSGVRIEVLERLVDMLNKRVHPVIPEKGSVGASGDLAPLSHMVLVLMGEGKAEYKGKVMDGREALAKAGIKPLKLRFKEGVALNNGTQMATAIAALNVHDAENLVKNAEIAAALSLEALHGIIDAFKEPIHRAKPYLGQFLSARNVRLLVEGSKLVLDGKTATQKLGYPQDPYCLRCVPQVFGAVRDSIAYVKRVVEIEMNSATDNPLVFGDEDLCISGGNFHGEHIAIAMDLLGIALSCLGNISERRIAMLLDEKLNRGLPAFLISEKSKKGINSGLMLAQYTAAALASENKVLAHPASVDSIPTSANFEDFVSMAPNAARKAMEILKNSQYIVAIEFLCACQAVDLRGPEKLGKGTKVAYSVVRKVVPKVEEDRILSGDIEKIFQLVRQGRIVDEVEKCVKLL